MTNRQPYIHPDQVDDYHKSCFANEPAEKPAPAAAAPAATKKPEPRARKSAKAAKSK